MELINAHKGVIKDVSGTYVHTYVFAMKFLIANNYVFSGLLISDHITAIQDN